MALGYEMSLFFSPILANSAAGVLVIGVPRSLQLRNFVKSVQNATMRDGNLLIKRDLVEQVTGRKTDKKDVHWGTGEPT